MKILTSKSAIATLILLALALLTVNLLTMNPALAKIGSTPDQHFYLVVNGTPIKIGEDKSNLIEKLGKPHHREINPVQDQEQDKRQNQDNADKGKNTKDNSKQDRNNQNKPQTEETLAWVFADGLTFISVIDAESQQLKEATISSTKQHANSYVVLNGDTNYLNDTNIDKLEDSYDESYRCLSFFEQDSLGWLDYSVKDKNSDNTYVTFSAINRSPYSLHSLEGKIETKVSIVDSISLSKYKSKYSKEIYCKQWFEK